MGELPVSGQAEWLSSFNEGVETGGRESDF